MTNLNQKGFVAQLLVFLLLIAGLGVGIYLVQTRTGWFSKAAPVIPQKPETSFELEAQADISPIFADAQALKSVGVGGRFRVDVWVRSDIDAANLFNARIKFPADLLQVVEINKRGGNSFVNQWIAEPSFNNSTGDISIIGGVKAPGLLTSSQSTGSVKGVNSNPTFDTRTMYVNSDGSRTESITAYGKYWNFNSANGWAPMDNNGDDLATVSRYANGPCQGHSPCIFDTRTMFNDFGGSRIESITAYGKYWNFNGSNGWAALDGNGADLTSVDRYANGPCSGHSPCTFDSRTMYKDASGVMTESITAYGKYWNFTRTTTSGWTLQSSGNLTDVSRYANGPCSGHSPCVFDTRTMYVNADGSRTESITAYGKYWNFNSANGWAPMDNNGDDLTSVSRYAGILVSSSTPTPTQAPIPPTPGPVATPGQETLITLCNGQSKTWSQIDSELRGANYGGPFNHSQSELDAYNRAACPSPTPVGGGNVQTCLGQRTWDDIDSGLKKANYGGSLDHSQGELDAFNRAVCPNPTPGSQATLMVPRLMATIIFEAKKTGIANLEFADDSQILRNSDSTNIISAKKGITLHITSTPVSAPIANDGSGLAICTNIAAALPLGKLPSGEDSYVVTGTKTVQLGVNATPFAKITWKPVTGITFSSSSSNPATITASADGTYEIGATARWEDPVDTANCPNVSITFQTSQPSYTPAPAASVPPQSLRHDGDVNSDGKFDLVDMSRLLSQFGQKGPSEADLNGDEIVNTMDVLKLRSILIQKGILKSS